MQLVGEQYAALQIHAADDLLDLVAIQPMGQNGHGRAVHLVSKPGVRGPGHGHAAVLVLVSPACEPCRLLWPMQVPLSHWCYSDPDAIQEDALNFSTALLDLC